MPIMARQADGSYAKVGAIIVGGGSSGKDFSYMFENGSIGCDGDTEARYDGYFNQRIRLKKEYAIDVPEGASHVEFHLTTVFGVANDNEDPRRTYQINTNLAQYDDVNDPPTWYRDWTLPVTTSLDLHLEYGHKKIRPVFVYYNKSYNFYPTDVLDFSYTFS